MAVRSREEIMSLIRTHLGEDLSDDALTLIEDMDDTLNNYESKDTEDWKSKYDELDSMWRKRYRDRFFQAPENEETSPEEVITDNEDDLIEESESKSFDELFEEKEDNSGY